MSEYRSLTCEYTWPQDFRRVALPTDLTVTKLTLQLLRNCTFLTEELGLRDERVFIFGEIPQIPQKIWDGLIISRENWWHGTPCWEWQRAKTSGYGYVWLDGTLYRVHRYVYLNAVGSADGLTIDHLCRNRKCSNPEHLEAVTNEENIRRGTWAGSSVRKQLAKTSCPNGHLYTEETLYVSPKRGDRQCRICMREAGRRYQEKRRRAQNG